MQNGSREDEVFETSHVVILYTGSLGHFGRGHSEIYLCVIIFNVDRNHLKIFFFLFLSLMTILFSRAEPFG